jgi:hypothetical protein
MCFYDDDCDWTAEVCEQNFIRAAEPAKCYECYRPIAVGEWCRVLHQQEHESCLVCEDQWSDDYIDSDRAAYDTDEEHATALAELADHVHTYGETFDATLCRECCLVLEAIYDLEEKEGCPEDARQPLIGALQDELAEDSGKWGEKKYVKHAVGMFPELASHKMCAEMLTD